jgi:hypothetical protein
MEQNSAWEGNGIFNGVGISLFCGFLSFYDSLPLDVILSQVTPFHILRL